MSKHRIGWISLIIFGAVLAISTLDAPWQEAVAGAVGTGLGLWIWGLTDGR